jgi:hypothetical protein
VSIPSDWRPLSQRYSEPSDEEPYEGVPPHLKSRILQWVQSYLTNETAEAIALRLRVDLRTGDPIPEPFEISGLIMATSRYEEQLLDVIDLVLFLDEDSYGADELDRILTLGGSVWRVSQDRRSLERRVDDTATAAAITLIEQPTNSASHLAAAWHYCYGRNPDTSRSYSESIKAVEAAAIPIVCPGNARATLGNVIRDLEGSEASWRLAITTQHGAGSIGPLLAMLRLLWHGQSDRHGGLTPTIPPSQTAAEMAVHLAVTLVQWFQSRAIDRVSTPSSNS